MDARRTGTDLGSSGATVTPGEVTADDGRRLAAHWYRPSGRARGAVLVVPAMATRSTYYDAFASWLAERGHLTLLFDYRGMESPQALREEGCDLLRWAHDAASALETLIDAAPGLPVTWVGHSLGGQVLPFARHDLVARIVLVSAGHGHWRYNVPAVRRKAHVLWRWVAPAVIRWAGYFPGRRLGVLDDVPADVMRQWIRWCLDERYLGVDFPDIAARYAEVSSPVTAISFEDDELLSDESMVRFEELLSASDLVRVRLTPDDLGVRRVGHSGFFRAEHREAWDTHVLPLLG